MKDAIRKASAGVVACFCAASLFGCGGESRSLEELDAEELSPHDLSIDVEDDGSGELSMRNETEYPIIEVRSKRIDAADFSEDLMLVERSWEPGQVVELSFATELPDDRDSAAINAAETGKGAAIEASEAGEPLLLNEVHDLRFTTADGSAFILHQLSLEALAGAEDISFRFDEASGLAYLVYLDDGNEVSTLEGEQHIAAVAAAIAEAEAASVA